MERKIFVLEEGVRFLTLMTLRLKRDAIESIMGEDLALQDYLANELCETDFDQDDVKSSLNYIAKVIETLKIAEKHQMSGYHNYLNTEERQVADMLWGMAPHKWSDKLIKVAKEVNSYIQMRLENRPCLPNKDTRFEFIRDILKEVEKICEKNDFALEKREDGRLSFELMYIGEWIGNKI